MMDKSQIEVLFRQHYAKRCILAFGALAQRVYHNYLRASMSNVLKELSIAESEYVNLLFNHPIFNGVSFGIEVYAYFYYWQSCESET